MSFTFSVMADGTYNTSEEDEDNKIRLLDFYGSNYIDFG